MFADSHIHLTHSSFSGEFCCLGWEDGSFLLQASNRNDLIKQLQGEGIGFCIEPGIELESNARLLALSQKLPGFLYPAVGVHPTRTWSYTIWDEHNKKVRRRLYLSDFEQLRKYARRPGVVAIGETGLDYHHPRKEQHRLAQKYWFVRQLLLAHKLHLPVVLHTRAADADALAILRLLHRQLHGGVCHCFCGDAETAKAYTGLGLLLGIGGMLLQRPEKCAALEDAVRRTPLESLVMETDGPYVKPFCPDLPEKQLRQARNTSLILPAVARRIAAIKGISPEEVERVTTENVRRVFRVPE